MYHILRDLCEQQCCVRTVNENHSASIDGDPMPSAMKRICTYACKWIEKRPPLALSFTWALLFLCATAIKTSPLTFWKWLSVPNHVGHDNVGHFHRGEWGVLGFFNKPLMCFVMHWLYFTVKTHSVPSPASALLPKLPFLQLPFVMLSTPPRRYHLFILWNNNPVKTKQPQPLPTYRLTVG